MGVRGWRWSHISPVQRPFSTFFSFSILYMHLLHVQHHTAQETCMFLCGARTSQMSSVKSSGSGRSFGNSAMAVKWMVIPRLLQPRKSFSEYYKCFYTFILSALCACVWLRKGMCVCVRDHRHGRRLQSPWGWTEPWLVASWLTPELRIQFESLVGAGCVEPYPKPSDKGLSKQNLILWVIFSPNANI